MTRFLDGPAKGKILMLKNAPYLLRVTQDGDNFDALDMPSDEPKPNEKLFAYVRKGAVGYAFVDGPKSRGRYVIAEYEQLEVQPADEVMRSLSAWENWTKGIVEYVKQNQTGT